MQLTRDAILRARQWALVAVRCLAFIFVLIGGISLVSSIAIAILGGDVDLLLATWDHNWNQVAHGLSFAVPGAALIVFDRKLVRWMIPVPHPECPRCGYDTEHVQSEHCPECGYRIAPERPAAAATPPAQDGTPRVPTP